jgi:hypothetical protein
VDLFEYQGKQLFADHGVPIQQGKVATTPQQAREIAAELIAAHGEPDLDDPVLAYLGGEFTLPGMDAELPA